MYKAIAFCLLLTSCAEFSSSQNLQACPGLVNYSSTFQAQAAKEIQALPANSAVVKMLEDYATLRQEVRECK